jgi:flavin reductase (DIM6/NTAB) family NADH-FMN oxidoreductase RutF
MIFDFKKLSTTERYKLMSFSIVPRPIAWVTTIKENGRRNAAPFSFFNIMASDPPILGIGIVSRPPRIKDTTQNIIRSGQFVVNLVPNDKIHEMNVTAIEFDDGIDEIEEAGLEVLKSEKVMPPRLACSPVAFECELFQNIALPSGQNIILGQVLLAHIADEAVINAEKCYIDTQALNLLGRLDNRYIKLDGVFDHPRIEVNQWSKK